MPENWKDCLAQGVFEVTYTFDASHSKKSTCTVFFVPIHYKLVNGDKVDKGLNMSVAYGNESFNFFVDYKLLDAFTDSGTFYLLNPTLSNFNVFFSEKFCKSLSNFKLDWLIRTNVVGRVVATAHDGKFES